MLTAYRSGPAIELQVCVFYAIYNLRFPLSDFPSKSEIQLPSCNVVCHYHTSPRQYSREQAASALCRRDYYLSAKLDSCIFTTVGKTIDENESLVGRLVDICRISKII